MKYYWKILMLGVTALLVGCASSTTEVESEAPTSQLEQEIPARELPDATSAVPPSPSPLVLATEAVVSINAPVIDGDLSPDEWKNANTETLSDGSELLMMQDDDYLYLGIRSAAPEMIGANVYVENSGQIRILHTSAALGTAVYQQTGGNWQLIRDFDWQCRDTSNSDSAKAERTAYLQENNWTGTNSRIGEPNELEYQINIMAASPRIAVSVFTSSAPDERAYWPSTLNDDTLRSYPGGLPAELVFSPDDWAPVSTSPAPAVSTRQP